MNAGQVMNPDRADSRKKVRIFRAVYLVIMASLSVLRVWCGQKVGNYFLSTQPYDDVLLIRYSDLRGHFSTPDPWSLCKTIGYPLFILAGHVLSISYTVMMNLLWVVTAIAFWRMMELLFRRHILSLLMFAYILFFPTAFDYLFGTRIYRNSIIAPFVILTFSLMMMNLHACVRGGEKTWRMIVRAVIGGILFTYTCYIKEDGAWIVASVGFFSAVSFLALIVRAVRSSADRKQKMRSFAVRAVCLILPGVIYFAGTECYLSLNEKYFGVREIQTRSEGELGTFVKYLYALEAEGRSAYVWTPRDAIEQVVAVSPTLKSETEFLDALYHSPWCDYDLTKTQFYGDWFTWAVRYALDEAGMWTSDAEVEKLFSEINGEVEAAFEDGRLKKSDRFQLQSSAGGMTESEIKELFPLVLDVFRGAIALDSYNPTLTDSDTGDPAAMEIAEEMTGIHDLAQPRSDRERAEGEKIGQCVFAVYRVVNPVLLILSLLAILLTVIRAIIAAVRRKKDREIRGNLAYAGCAFVFFGISAVYAFAIAWFTDFLFRDGFVMELLNFYSIGAPAILAMAYGIGMGCLARLIRSRIGVIQAGRSQNETVSD